MVCRGQFLPLLVILGQVKRTDAGSNCSVTPDTAREGEYAHLTCRFSVDIQENTKNFYVQISNDSVFKIDEKVVVDCGWPKQSPFPACTISDGYSEPIIAGHTVTINIMNANERHAGHYKCFVVNPDTQSTPDSCVFTVGFEYAEKSRSDSGAISTRAIIGIAVGVGLVAVTVAVVVVCCYRHNQCRKCQRSGDQQEPARNPDGEEMGEMLPAKPPNVREIAAQFEGLAARA